MEQFPENWQSKRKQNEEQISIPYFTKRINILVNYHKIKIQRNSRRRGRKHTLRHIYLIHHEPEENHRG